MAEKLVLRSTQARTKWLCIGTIAVGVLFLALTQGKAELSENYLAAHWLGYLLAVVGLAGLIFTEDVTVTVDREARGLLYEARSLRGTTRRLIPSATVASVYVRRTGRASSPQTNTFSIDLKLKSGEWLRTNHWSFNEGEIQATAQELAQAIGCEKGGVPERIPTSLPLVLAASLAIGVIGWVIYYRTAVGPLGPAMWMGNAPPIAILAISLVAFNTLRYLRKPRS